LCFGFGFWLSGLDCPRLLLFDGCRASADLNSTRLHRLWHPAHQVNVQEPVVEGRAFDLDVIGEAKIALK
jgi:hypothetical protein